MMGETMVEVTPGVTLPFLQVAALGMVGQEMGDYHWHLNECGCCVTLHGDDCAAVVGPDGGVDWFPGRGCECPPEGES